MISAFFLSNAHKQASEAISKILGKAREVAPQEFQEKLAAHPAILNFFNKTMLQEAFNRLPSTPIHTPEALQFLHTLAEVFDSSISSETNGTIEQVAQYLLSKQITAYNDILEAYRHQVNGIITDVVAKSLSSDRLIWENLSSQISPISPPPLTLLSRHAATHVLLLSYPSGFVHSLQLSLLSSSLSPLLSRELTNITINPYHLHAPDTTLCHEVEESKWSLGTRVKKAFSPQEALACALRRVFEALEDEKLIEALATRVEKGEIGGCEQIEKALKELVDKRCESVAIPPFAPEEAPKKEKVKPEKKN